MSSPIANSVDIMSAIASRIDMPADAFSDSIDHQVGYAHRDLMSSALRVENDEVQDRTKEANLIRSAAHAFKSVVNFVKGFFEEGSEFDIYSLVKDLGNEAKIGGDYSQKDFQIRSLPITRHIKANQDLIRHVLSNLIRNAFEAADSVVEVYLSDRDGMMKAEIKDNGKLFPSDFDIDQLELRTEGDRKRGLGLYFANKLIKSLGGSITIKNESCDKAVVVQFPFDKVESVELKAPPEIIWIDDEFRDNDIQPGSGYVIDTVQDVVKKVSPETGKCTCFKTYEAAAGYLQEYAKANTNTDLPPLVICDMMLNNGKAVDDVNNLIAETWNSASDQSTRPQLVIVSSSDVTSSKEVIRMDKSHPGICLDRVVKHNFEKLDLEAALKIYSRAHLAA